MALAPPSDIVAALKDYRLKVVEWPGWRIRGSSHPFDPYAQAWHHDAFQEQYDDAAAARFMAELGRPDLPPPLSNGTVGNYGTVYLIAYGNANHAGRNEADVHARLRQGLAPLGDAKADPDGDTVIGNPHLWGWECRNAGTGHDPWDQLDVMMRAGAAMADCCSWSPMASAGHRELTARKIDPFGFDMTAFRAGISRAQASHHTPALEEDDMQPKFVKVGTDEHGAFVLPDGRVLDGLTDEEKSSLKAVYFTGSANQRHIDVVQSRTQDPALKKLDQLIAAVKT